MSGGNKVNVGSNLDPLVEAYHRNGRVNSALLDAVTEADFILSDGQGGMSVGQLLEHLVGVRKVYLDRVGSRFADQITVQTEEGDQQFWNVTLNVAQLKQAFAESDAAVLNAVQDALNGGGDFLNYFASNPVQMLILMLVHDANHRGQITTLLRQGGRSEEQSSQLAAATWPVWRE